MCETLLIDLYGYETLNVSIIIISTQCIINVFI